MTSPLSPTQRTGRHLGVDYGTRRVGLAASDESGTWVTPLTVLQVSSPEQALAEVASVARAEGSAVLVVGLPLNMDDTEGPAARSVRVWSGRLSKFSGLPVVFVDERLSSFEAEQSLIDRKRAGEKMTRKGKKQRLDAVAAAQFLQSYLEKRLAPLPGSADEFFP